MRTELVDLGQYDLDGRVIAVPCSGFAFAGIQVIPIDYSATTGVIELKRSLTGNAADAVSFATSVTPNMTSKAISDAINVRDVAFVHVANTTADSGKTCRVVVHLSEE